MNETALGMVLLDSFFLFSIVKLIIKIKSGKDKSSVGIQYLGLGISVIAFLFISLIIYLIFD